MKTINYSLSLLLFVLITSTSFAQINYGFRNGLAATTFALKGNLPDNNNVTFSYTAGAFVDLPVGNSIYIQPEINYARKGRSMETSELNSAIETDYTIHYLQVPVLLQYRDNEMQDKRGYIFYVNAGPYAAFALDDQTKPTLSTMPDESKKTDWGATIGIGLQTPIIGKDIRFDLRYDMGLSKIANQPEDYRTKALSLTVGISL
jgi:hypothetical protein